MRQIQLLNIIAKTIRANTRTNLADRIEFYLQLKYGQDETKSYGCLVYIEDGCIVSELSGANTKIPIKNLSGEALCNVIRGQASQLVHLKHGLPQPDAAPPVVVLLPDLLSMVFSLGFKETYKFLKAWPGQTKAGQIDIVRYTILN